MRLIFKKITKLFYKFYINFVWRKRNKHNYTNLKSIVPIECIQVGRNTYGDLNFVWLTDKASIAIGNYVSIASNVKFLVGGEHNYKRISTYPFQSLVYKQKTSSYINKNIVIEDDVWIGYDCLILSGVTIGQGSVIGARSTVAKDVPPYSIYVGNKIIKRRFPTNIIEKLSNIDYSSIDHTDKDLYSKYCQLEVNEDNIDDILNLFIEH